jgi:hypothetical protein
MRMRSGIWGMAGAVLCMLAGCSSTGTSADAGSTGMDAPGTGIDAPSGGGMCGAGIPAGQECSAVRATGAPVTPTCVSGTLPSGQGGTIVDGTYVLTAQTYYNRITCPTIAVSETVAFGGGCLEIAAGVPLSVTASGTFTVSGANFMSTLSCVHFDVDGGTFRPNTAAQTFTATATTFTLFSSDAPDAGTSTNSVTVFTKQ